MTVVRKHIVLGVVELTPVRVPVTVPTVPTLPAVAVNAPSLTPVIESATKVWLGKIGSLTLMSRATVSVLVAVTQYWSVSPGLALAEVPAVPTRVGSTFCTDLVSLMGLGRIVAIAMLLAKLSPVGGGL